MKLKLTFKDGVSLVQNHTQESFKQMIDVNFLKPMFVGYENNKTITLNDDKLNKEIERDFSELHSIEIIFPK